MARVGMSSNAVKKFKKGGPVAKGKKKKREQEDDEALEAKHAERQSKSRRKAPEYGRDAGISGGALRGVMDETMARVYEEMWPNMTTRDENDDVHYEIKEESYILALGMVTGRDEYQPRRGLKIKEAEIGDTIGFCAEHN